MTPLKRPLFLTIITLFTILFIAILTRWLVFVVTNFRTMSTVATPPSVIATPNQTGIDTLVPKKK